MMKVTFMGHSGFLLEMDRVYCLFDYYKGEFPELDTRKKMAVFVSHAIMIISEKKFLVCAGSSERFSSFCLRIFRRQSMRIKEMLYVRLPMNLSMYSAYR